MLATTPETTSHGMLHDGDRYGRGQHFTSIQMLRGLAAVAIVLNHSFWALPVDVPPTFGAGLLRATLPFGSGVDVFFIVSGFVMAAATSGAQPPTPQAFLLRRAVRILPLYWLACLIYLPGALLVPRPGILPPDVSALIRSFLLMPQPQPLIAQSWTLTHEWQFYGVVALSLAFGLRRHLASVVALSAILALLQVKTGTLLANQTVVSGFMVEFLAGLLLFQSRHWLWAQMPSPRASGCFLLGVGILAVEAMCPWHPDGLLPRLLLSGGPALLIVLGAVALEASLCRQTHPVWRLARLLGDTSYSIYLFHLCILSGCGTLFALLGARTPAVLWAAALLAVIVATAFGVAVGVLIERPLQTRTKAWLAGGRRLVSAPAE